MQDHYMGLRDAVREMAGPDADIDEDVIHIQAAYQVPGRELARRPLGLGSFLGQIDPSQLASQAQAGPSQAGQSTQPATDSPEGSGTRAQDQAASLEFIHSEIVRLTRIVETNNTDSAAQMAMIRADVWRLYTLTGHAPPAPPPDAEDISLDNE